MSTLVSSLYLVNECHGPCRRQNAQLFRVSSSCFFLYDLHSSCNFSSLLANSISRLFKVLFCFSLCKRYQWRSSLPPICWIYPVNYKKKLTQFSVQSFFCKWSILLFWAKISSIEEFRRKHGFLINKRRKLITDLHFPWFLLRCSKTYFLPVRYSTNPSEAMGITMRVRKSKNWKCQEPNFLSKGSLNSQNIRWKSLYMH